MRYMTAESLTNDEKNIKTPLAFAHYGERQGLSDGYGEVLKEAGWTQVTSQLNWHNYHNGDTNLPIWMKKFPAKVPEAKETFKASPKSSYYPEHNSFAFGCGGRLINGFKEFDVAKLRNANSEYWYRFTTLIRVKGGMKRPEARKAWLAAMNYRELPEFATSEASYWVNGFPVAEWAKNKEHAFWTKFKMPKPFESGA